MSTSDPERLIEQFLQGISAGHVPDDLLAPDMTFWSINSGELADQQRFQGGIGLLAQVANRTMRYDIVSLTAEEDRVVAEIQSSGMLMNGEAVQNNHVFLFTLRDGLIASVREYMNPIVVREKIVPLMQALMEKTQR